MRSVFVLLLAIGLIAMGLPAANAGVTVMVEDNFDDGDIFSNPLGTGSGHAQNGWSKTYGEVAGGPATWQTDGDDWSRQELHSLDEINFLALGGTTRFEWEIANVAVTSDMPGDIDYRLNVDLIPAFLDQGLDHAIWEHVGAGLFVDVTFDMGSPDQAFMNIYSTDRTKTSQSWPAAALAAATLNWNWSTEPSTFAIDVDADGFTATRDGAMLLSSTWADAGFDLLDGEFGTGAYGVISGQNIGYVDGTNGGHGGHDLNVFRVIHTSFPELTWASGVGDGPWNSLTQWSTPGTIPDALSTVIIQDHTVTVQGVDGETFSLSVEGGALAIADDRRLALGGNVSFAAGTTLTMGNNSTLSVGGSGNLGATTAQGNATFDVGDGGIVGIADFTGSAGGGVVAKTGEGTLTIGSSAKGFVALATTFKVQAGELRGMGNSLLGGTSHLELAGGMLTIDAPTSGALQPGLLFGALPGDPNLVDPNPNTSVTVDLAETEGPIPGNTTHVFTGQFFDADGNVSFTEHIDDRTFLRVDGALVLDDNQWDVRTESGNLALDPGWHDFELRLSNGGGGSGPVEVPGFGFDPDGGTTYVHLEDPGDGSLFRTDVMMAIDMQATTVDVTGSATLNPATPLTASFGQLTLNDGTLTTIGALGGLDFASTRIEPAPGVTRVGLDPQVTTDYGQIDGTGATVTLAKAGPGNLVLDEPNVNLESAVIKSEAGYLAMVGMDPWGGSTQMELGGGTFHVEGSATGFQPGLLFGTLPNYMDRTTPNPGNMGVDPLGPSASELWADEPYDNSPWDYDITLVYTGQIYDEDGIISFYESIDDIAYLVVAGQVALDDQSPEPWITRTASGTMDLGGGGGWYDFELRMTNGVGGAGVADGSSVGIGYDPTGTATTTDDVLYIHPQNFDENTADVFRTNAFAATVDMTSHTVRLTADTTLEVAGADTVAFGPLTMEDGVMTTAGVIDAVSFLNTDIPNDGTERSVGVDLHLATDLNSINANSGTVTFSKSGPVDLALEDEHSGLENTTFEAREGRLIGLHGSNPFQTAKLAVNGGELVLASKAGDVVYDNALEVLSDGTLTAGTGDQAGADAGPLSVTLGSQDAKANGVTLTAGTVAMRSTGEYKLEVAGQLDGPGGVSVAEGDVTLSGGGQIGSLTTTGGALTIGPGLATDVMTVSGGVVDTGENQVTVNQKLQLGQPVIFTDAPILVSGPDLLTDSNIDVSGAQVTIRGELAANPNLPAIAYDGFDYPSGALAGQDGGNGWAGAWSGGGGAWVDEPGLTYTDANDTPMTAGGNTSRVTGWADYRNIDTMNVPPELRDVDGKIGADDTSVWVAFLANLTEAGEQAPLTLYDGDQEELRLGKQWQNDYWGIDDRGLNWIVPSNTPVSEPVFFVARIDFLPGDDQVHVWLNPLLDPDPTDDEDLVPDDLDADISTGVDEFRFDRVDLWGDADVQYDELRIGATYNEVAPAMLKGALNLPSTDITVATTSELTLDTDLDASFDDLVMLPGAALTMLGASARFHDVSAGHDATFTGEFSVSGTLSPGDGVAAMLNVAGGIEMDETTVFDCEIAGWDSTNVADPWNPIPPTGPVNDRIQMVAGDAILGGALELTAVDKLHPAVEVPGQPGVMVEWYGDQTRVIAAAAGEDSVSWQFDTATDAQPEVYDLPGTGNWSQGHLGHGVFLTRLSGDDPVVHPGVTYTANATEVHLFQAADGDTNGDRRLGSLDIQAILSANTFPDVQPTDWVGGDFTGDGWCNGLDIQAILSTGLYPFLPDPYAAIDPGDPGDQVVDLLLYPEDATLQDGTVVPAGTLMIDPDGLILNGYVLRSEAGIFTGAPAQQLNWFFVEDTDRQISGNMGAELSAVHDLGAVIGPEWTIINPFDKQDVNPFDDLTLTYTVAGTPGTFVGNLIVVPEPSTLLMLLAGGLGLLFCAIRRRRWA